MAPFQGPAVAPASIIRPESHAFTATNPRAATTINSLVGEEVYRLKLAAIMPLIGLYSLLILFASVENSLKLQPKDGKIEHHLLSLLVWFCFCFLSWLHATRLLMDYRLCQFII